MKPLRFALIGYGFWGKIIYRVLQNSRSATITNICDVKRQTIDEIRLFDKKINVTNSFQNIISDNKTDAVIIATPTATHYKLAAAALKSGKHVLVEKSMTILKSHAQILCTLAKKNKLILMVDHTYLYAPEIRIAKQIIETGKLGVIKSIDIIRTGPYLSKSDCDVIWDFAPHDISILYYFFQAPYMISASNSWHFIPNRADISNLYLKFTNGYDAYIHLSFLSPIKKRQIIIVGTKKTLLIEQSGITGKIYLYPSDIYFNKNQLTDDKVQFIDCNKQLSHLKYTEPLKNVCDEFIKSIRYHTEPLSNGHLGYEVVKIIETAQKSLLKKYLVKI
jgi:predicted dehydrogenase